jgi:hypothetical protein
MCVVPKNQRNLAIHILFLVFVQPERKIIISTNVILFMYVYFYFLTYKTLQEFHIMSLKMLDLASQ